jgi:hypothetical protein
VGEVLSLRQASLRAAGLDDEKWFAENPRRQFRLREIHPITVAHLRDIHRQNLVAIVSRGRGWNRPHMVTRPTNVSEDDDVGVGVHLLSALLHPGLYCEGGECDAVYKTLTNIVSGRL